MDENGLTLECDLLLFIRVNLDLRAGFDDGVLALLQKAEGAEKNDERDGGPGLVVALFAFRRTKLSF